MSEDRRSRARSKTKDPNDVDEEAAPRRARGRTKTKDPNDVEDVPDLSMHDHGPSMGYTTLDMGEELSSAPGQTSWDEEEEQVSAPSRGRMGSKGSNFSSFSESYDDFGEGSLESLARSPRFKLTYNDHALLSRYRTDYAEHLPDSTVGDETSEPSTHDSQLSARYASGGGTASRSSTADRSSTLRDAGRSSSRERRGSERIHRFSDVGLHQELHIEDVGDSGEERQAMSAQKKSLEITALPGSLVPVGKLAKPSDAARRAKGIDTSESGSEGTAADSENEWHAEVSESEFDDLRKRAPGEEEYVDEFKGLVEINTTGMLCGFTVMYYWAAMAAGTLFANVWQYIFDDSKDLALLAADTAVKQAKVQLAEVLEPAVATMRVLDLAFRSGVVTSRLDYLGIHRVLAPQFLLQPTLLEVELVDPLESITSEGRGSLLVSRAKSANGSGTGLLELKTRMEDCAATGCLANASVFYPEGSWYEAGRVFTVPLDNARAPDGSWYGPCVGSCEFPSYSWVGRIAGGPDGTFSGQSSTPPPALVGRATLEMQDFLAATRRAAATSGDENSDVAAMLCTEQGQVMAGLNSAGSPVPQTMPRIWTMGEEWSKGADQSFVSAGTGEPRKSEGFILTSWALSSFMDTYPASDWQLRLVLAAPDTTFRDSVLYPLHPWIIIVAACPVVGALLLVMRMVYIRVHKRYKKSKIAAAATNLRNNLDSSIKDATVQDAMEAFERETALDKIHFQDEETAGIRRGERHSIVFAMSFLQAAKAKTNRGGQSVAASFNDWMGRRKTVQENWQASPASQKKASSRFSSMLGFGKRGSVAQGGGNRRMSARELQLAKETLTKGRTKVRS